MPIAFPYISLVLFLGVCGLLYQYTGKESQKLGLICACVMVFWIFFAFRGYILGDWTGYYLMFKDVQADNIVNLEVKSDEKFAEPGFMLLMYLTKCIYNNFMFFTWLCATINTVLFVNFLRRTVDNIPFALMLYVAYGGLVMSTDLMRNSLALFIIMNGLIYLQQRKILPYMGLCILATMFHFSSIIFMPLYFVFHKSLPKYVFLAALSITFPLRLAHITFVEIIAKMLHMEENFQLMYRAYIEVYDSAGGSILEAVVYVFIGLLVFCYYDKLKKIHPLSIIVVNAIVIYILLWMLFGEFDELCKRVTVLFGFGIWLTPCYLIKCFGVENNRRLFIAFIMLLSVKYMAGISHPAFEYDNMLWGTKSYEQRLYIHDKYGVD